MAGGFALSAHPVLNPASLFPYSASKHSPRPFGYPFVFRQNPSAFRCSSFLETGQRVCRKRLCARQTETHALFVKSSEFGRGGNFKTERKRKLPGARLHALDNSADAFGRDDSGESEREGQSDQRSGERRSVSTNESAEGVELGEVSKPWEEKEISGASSNSEIEGQQSAEASGERVGFLESSSSSESSSSTSDPSSNGSDPSSNSSEAASEEAQTQRILNILHRREGPSRTPARSLQERSGGFRVSGPQVPMTLQPLKAQSSDEKAGGGSKESQEEEGGEVDRDQETSVSSERLPTEEGSAESIPLSEDKGAALDVSAEGSSDSAENSGPQPSKPEGGEKKEEEERPLVIPPGAEIPIPPRTEEDERLIAAFEKKLNSGYKVEGLESELGLYVAKVKALESFKAELARPDDDIDVVRAAALIAQHAYPECTPEGCEAELRLLAEDLKLELPPPAERYPLRMIKAINKFVFTDRGFKGTYEAKSSEDLMCINKVLENKTGQPILISMVYLELARRVGFPMAGVDLPALLLLRPLLSESEFLVNANDGGKLMFREDIISTMNKLFFADVRVAPEFPTNVPTVAKRDYLVRILSVLKKEYFRERRLTQCLAIIEYLKIVRSGIEGASELRDAGLCFLNLRRLEEASASLTQYLEVYPTALDRKAVREILQKIRDGQF